MKWQRTALITILAVVLLASGAGLGAAQSQDSGESGVEQCSADSDDFVECLQNQTTTEDVQNWIEKSPDELSENQVTAIIEANISSLSDDQVSKINDYRKWASGALQPDWWSSGDSSGENSSEEATTDSSSSSSSSESSVEKYRQIRSGQWLTEKPTWHSNGTGTAVIYSDYDSRVALVDGGDCDGTQEVCSPDITQTDLDGGETTTIHFDASIKQGAFGQADQQVALNSLIGEGGEYRLALMELSDSGFHLFEDDPIWSHVWVAVFSAVFTLSVLAIATYTYLYWSSRRLERNLFDHLRDSL